MLNVTAQVVFPRWVRVPLMRGVFLAMAAMFYFLPLVAQRVTSI
jgi:hypothetical protein